ncbi:hypothetical protein SHVI106290_01585 [Shewanella violacea]
MGRRDITHGGYMALFTCALKGNIRHLFDDFLSCIFLVLPFFPVPSPRISLLIAT